MKYRKMGFFMISIFTISWLSGCVNVSKLVKSDETYHPHIEHQIFNEQLSTDASVLAIFNEIGDVKLIGTEAKEVSVNVIMRQTKGLKDLEKKLSNISISPEYIEDIMLIEPLTPEKENYWEWINNNLNANGILVDFEILVPESITEIRVYEDIGNIKLENIDAKITAHINLGTIIGTNVVARDISSFISGMATESSKSINIEFSDLNYANRIIVGTEMGEVKLRTPHNAVYDYQQLSEFDIEEIQNRDARERCLDKVDPVAQKTEETVIVSNKGDEPLITFDIQ